MFVGGDVKEINGRELPQARGEKLLVQELGDELLVYDLERDKAHCLNRTAALVWQHCDGHTTLPELAQHVNKELKTEAGEEIVGLALKQLSQRRLLESEAAWMERAVSRRALLLRLGVLAVTLPLVTTIVAPTALAAASCGVPCSMGSCPAGCTCCVDNICRAVC
jgi:hypothetical protein